MVSVDDGLGVAVELLVVADELFGSVVAVVPVWFDMLEPEVPLVVLAPDPGVTPAPWVDGLLVPAGLVAVLLLPVVPVCATAIPTAATAAASVRPLRIWLILKLLIPVDARPEADPWAARL
jgi:hypothetical protein